MPCWKVIMPSVNVTAVVVGLWRRIKLRSVYGMWSLRFEMPFRRHQFTFGTFQRSSVGSQWVNV